MQEWRTCTCLTCVCARWRVVSIRGVQVVDTHGGFKRLAAWIKADQRQTLTWFITMLTFGMSAVLDNLTTTIVMVSILQVGRIDKSHQLRCTVSSATSRVDFAAQPCNRQLSLPGHVNPMLHVSLAALY